ncbi:MAG: thiamine-phosphate kinase [Dehalococcoidia bacterium]|nr:thiamine-phosphate kinase [Dehalococcoidia bacterium]
MQHYSKTAANHGTGLCYNHGMRIAEAGEFNLIASIAALIERRCRKRSPAWKDLIIGIGDDAAAWKNAAGLELMTTDVMVEGVHFDFSYTSWKDLGWKAMAANISDINSMGGRPQYALVSLCVPGWHNVDDVLEMYEGTIELCNVCRTAIAGGNVAAADKVVINISLSGTAQGQLMTRSSACPGDSIAVFGYPGLAAAGLRVLQGKINITGETADLLKTALLHPMPDYTAGPRLAKMGVRTAIDTSDGLLADLGHICRASRTGAVLHLEKLPLHPALSRYFGRKGLDLALGGGEDYGLLITASSTTLKKVIAAFKPAPTVIGEVTAGPAGKVSLLNARGREVSYRGAGWDHFKSKP